MDKFVLNLIHRPELVPRVFCNSDWTGKRRGYRR